MTTATLTHPRKAIDLPVQLDQATALDPTVIAAELGDARRARRWLTGVVNATPDVLEAHLELSRMVVLVERALPGAALPGTIAAAIAHDDWQSAYDLSMATKQGSASALANLLLVADAVNAAGQPDAAINLLSQALDLYEQTPAIYWALIQIMTQQGRIEDAQDALILLRDALTTV